MHIARSRVMKSFFHLLPLHLIPSQGFHFGGNFATFSDSTDFSHQAEVLSAPAKLVCSELILRFTRKLLVAVAEKWDSHVLVMDKVPPQNWKV
ncbi:hypothetical protein Hanom_Chr13g01219501 [Helianthus anomalus]